MNERKARKNRLERIVRAECVVVEIGMTTTHYSAYTAAGLNSSSMANDTTFSHSS